MYYKIVKYCGPDNDGWGKYLEWRKLQLDSFDSIDSILRPDLFEPQSDEDWKNCVQEDFKLSLITDLEYAKSILHRYNKAILIGVELVDDIVCQSKEYLLGYDILDSCCSISLLTNWGIDEENIFSKHIKSNGLLPNIQIAFEIKNKLRNEYNDDDHAKECDVWGIYKIHC